MMKFRRSILFTLVALFMAVVTAAVNPLGVMAKDNNAEKYISDMRIGYGDDGKKALEAAGYTVWCDAKGNVLNANETGAGKDVYIGYKTTANADEAITDLATMNMDGQYSFEDYQAHINDLKSNVTAILGGFLTAVKEVAANNAAGSAYAATAMKVLDCYYHEDFSDKTTDEQGNEKVEYWTIADFIRNNYGLTENSEQASVWHQILLEGNADNTSVIEFALALGCTEQAGNTFLDRLENETYSAAEPDPALSQVRAHMLEELPKFQAELIEAETYYETLEIYAEERLDEEAYEAFMASLSEEEAKNHFFTVDELELCSPGTLQAFLEEMPEEDRTNAVYEITLYEICKTTAYGNLTLDGCNASLFDVMMLPTQATTLGEVYLDAAKIQMLAHAMTPGQRGLVVMVGLSTLVGNAAAVVPDEGAGNQAWNNEVLKNLNRDLDSVEGKIAISVFAGVDRSLFEDTDDVAMTSAAIEASRKYRDISWGQDTSKSWKEDTATKNAMLIMTAASAAVGMGCLIASAALKTVTTVVTETVYTVIGHGCWFIKNGAEITVYKTMEAARNALAALAEQEIHASAYYNGLGEQWITTQKVTGTQAVYPILSKALAIIGIVAMIVACVFAVLTMVTWLYKPSSSKPNYSRIPRALVEEVENAETGEKSLYNYYAVKRIDADEASDNSLLIYGDLNALNGEVDCQWLCLYYSKDPALGAPLTTELLVTRGNEGISPEESLEYAPIHMFHDVGAANLNGYSLTHRSDPDADPDVIRAYVKRSQQVVTPEPEPTNPDTGTLFSTGNIAVGVICLIVGAGLSGGITYILTKRQKRREAA